MNENLLGLFGLFGKVVAFVKDKRTNLGSIWYFFSSRNI
jgi:hypothetical protein